MRRKLMMRKFWCEKVPCWIRRWHCWGENGCIDCNKAY